MKNVLRKSDYEQLRYYVNKWEGDYYGKRRDFLARHDRIVKFINDGIAESGTPKRKESQS